MTWFKQNKKMLRVVDETCNVISIGDAIKKLQDALDSALRARRPGEIVDIKIECPVCEGGAYIKIKQNKASLECFTSTHKIIKKINHGKRGKMKVKFTGESMEWAYFLAACRGDEPGQELSTEDVNPDFHHVCFATKFTVGEEFYRPYQITSGEWVYGPRVVITDIEYHVATQRVVYLSNTTQFFERDMCKTEYEAKKICEEKNKEVES